MFKLVSYMSAGGAVRSGVLVNGEVFDLSAAIGGDQYADMQNVLEDWEKVLPQVEKFVSAPGGSAVGGEKDLQLVAPLPKPGAVYCAAANYRDHMLAMAKKLGTEPEPDPHELDVTPYHFIKPTRASIVGPDVTVAWPGHADNLDWEAELVAVIGRAASNVSIDEALDYVAGYMVGNDISVRDRHYMKRPNVSEGSLFRTDFLGMKGFVGSCPIGPYLVPASDIPDPQNLAIKLWVDGDLKQDSHTGQMVFSTAEQISYLSKLTTLYPGDLVMTGTPAGTGAESDTFLKSGQVMKAWIENVGDLSTTMG